MAFNCVELTRNDIGYDISIIFQPKKIYSHHPISIAAIANAVFCIERFARLDSSSSAVKNMDERVAKMWMLRYAVGILAILHNNETLCWGLVNDIFTVGLW